MVFRTLATLSGLLALVGGGAFAENSTSTQLPVFFFHGFRNGHARAANYVANLTAEGRVVVPLTFCENECSYEAIKSQVPMAIAQLEEIVTGNSTFDDGYVFIGHSQGGQISRSVIEAWDDHKVRKYISLAGVQNGVFFGPQDVEATYEMSAFNADAFPATTGFDYTAYSLNETYGQMQYDLMKFHLLNPKWQYQYSQSNLLRSPHFESWAAANPHLPIVNNVNPCAVNDTLCEDAKAQRKANFLKLEEAHFFGSPADERVTPWQATVLGQTSEVETLDEILTEFANLTILNMTETREYVNDTYGLKTLDERGGLFIHEVSNVGHSCWVADQTMPDGSNCSFAEVYDQHVYSVLK
jgi:palmitoyl-protein thioesterase